METGLKAFFYDYKYYLLPENCESVEDVKKLRSTEVRRLKEENCMAPNFVCESIETEFLTIEVPDRVFAATVNLCTREEYDVLLGKQVEKRCPGCARFGGGADDLTGHHREMSLEGVCYSRETKGEAYSFGRCARWFSFEIAESVNVLAEYIDKGDQKSVGKLVNGLLTQFFPPVDVYGGVAEGRYCLCLSENAYSRHGVRLIVKMLADTANHPSSPLAQAGWTVYPYFPKGIYFPALRPNYFKRPPKLFYADNPEDDGAEIVVYEKGSDEWSPRRAASRKSALYKFLCHYIGEDILLAGSSSISVTGTLPGDKRAADAEELARLVEARARAFFQNEPLFPPPLYLQSDGAQVDALPYKENTRTWVTLCPEFSPERLPEEPESNNTVFEALGIVYAYIYLPGRFIDGLDMEKKETLDWYLGHAGEYPEPITEPGSWEIFVKGAGFVLMPDGMCNDYMVFDEKEFFRVLRNLAPVLEGLHAKIVTVKKDGVIVYEPGYVIRPEDSGICS